MPRYNRVSAGVALTIALGGCTAGEGSGRDAALIVPAESVHVMGTAETLAYVIDLEPSPDGGVWVLNNREPYVIAFGPDGRVVSTAGKRGQGPHEFRTPVAIVSGPASEDVWVSDGGRGTLVRVTGPEDGWRELALPRDSAGLVRPITFDNLGMGVGRQWLNKLEVGFVLGRPRPGTNGTARLWNADVVLLDPVSATLTTLFSPTDLLGDPTGSLGAPGLALMPYPMWAMCSARTFVVYDPLRNAVRRIEDGQETSSHPLPPERHIEVTLDRAFRIVYEQMKQDVPAAQRPDSATMYEQLRAEFDGARMEMSTVFPEYSGLNCTGDGVIWIQPFDIETGYMGRGPQWLRIAPDGTTRAVTLPARFRAYRFAGGRVWGVMLDELDVQSIAWIQLE
jgi:hypothetical protein